MRDSLTLSPGIRICATTLAVVLSAIVQVTPANAASAWNADHDEAVRIARRGDTTNALAILGRLHKDHPDDSTITRDLIVVLDWAGQDDAAIEQYKTLPPGPLPDYVTEAVGRAYRRIGQPAMALVVYRQGLTVSPLNESFAAGDILSLVDLDEPDVAIAQAELDLHAHGERVQVLLAAAQAALKQAKPVEAVRYDDRALGVDPNSRDAIHDHILAYEAMGTPQLARAEAERHPGILSPAEYRHVEGSEAAALVRWGVVEPVNEATRFAATDRAIAALDTEIARWQFELPDSADDIRRARYDRMIALRDRVRMSLVLAEYDDLHQSGTVIPNYALIAAADAYLYLREPEQARDLYAQILQTDPTNLDARLGLAYAYVDLEEWDLVYAQADLTDRAQPRWRYLKGLDTPVENPGRLTADLLDASVRLYADDLAESDARFAALANAAPDNSHMRVGIGTIDTARGWPRLAEEEYAIGLARKHPEIGLEIGQADNSLALRDYQQTETRLDDLELRFPENLQVQRLDREWDVHNMAELHIEAEQAFRSSTNISGGSGLTVDARLYTPPIDYNWRLFAGEGFINEGQPLGEGRLVLNRPNVGAEYRDRDVVATIEADDNVFRAATAAGGSVDRQDAGLHAAATWSIDDYWQVGGIGELFSHDTPTRAIRAGITADAGSAFLIWRESESREFRLDTQIMTFSDGNVRTSAAGHWTERLFTSPRFTIDGIAGLAESQNSANEDRLYYNPAVDVLASTGVEFGQTLYRRFEFIYDHQLVLTPGLYWERGFGEKPVIDARYEQRLRVNDVFELSLGAGYSRQPYDGALENAYSVLFDMTARF